MIQVETPIRRNEITRSLRSLPVPVPAQIGGVARADGACPVTYRGV